MLSVTAAKIRQRIAGSPWLFTIFVVALWYAAMLLIFTIADGKLADNPEFPAPRLEGPTIVKSTANWDSFNYGFLVTNGYPKRLVAAHAFFPVFPLLVAGLMKIGFNLLVAGALINAVSVVLACYFLFRLAGDYFKDDVKARRVMMLFLFSPAAYFLVAFYTEAVFCALAFGTLWFARSGRWVASCVLLALAAATRVPGLLLLVPVVIEYLQQRQFKLRRIDRHAFAFLIVPVGLAAHLIYLKYRTGDPLAFFHANRMFWTYQSLQPNIFKTAYDQAHTIARVIKLSNRNDIAMMFDMTLPFAAWLLAVAATAWAAIRRVPLSYVAFGVVSVIFFSLNGNFVSDHRYLISLVPIYFMVVSIVRDESLYALVLGSSAVTMGFLLTLFVNTYWTG